MDQDEVEEKKIRKKERGQYPAILTKQAGSIKVPIRRTFSCRTNWEIQMGKMGHLRFMPGIGSCLVSNTNISCANPNCLVVHFYKTKRKGLRLITIIAMIIS